MSTVIRDLCPDDIKSADVVSPEAILDFQTRKLESRTNGLLAGDVSKQTLDDRIVLAFEVVALCTERRMRLFEVHHRQDFEYPAAIVPPDVSLPDFLKDKIYRPGPKDIMGAITSASSLGNFMDLPGECVENDWIASSPDEFCEKIKAVLARPAVKAIVFSLMSGGSGSAAENGNTEES